MLDPDTKTAIRRHFGEVDLTKVVPVGNDGRVNGYTFPWLYRDEEYDVHFRFDGMCYVCSLTPVDKKDPKTVSSSAETIWSALFHLRRGFAQLVVGW